MVLNYVNKWMWTPAERKKRRQAFAKSYPGANYLLKQVKSLREMINVEYKYLDTTLSYNSSTTGGLSSLSDMATGNTTITRVGNSIKATSFNAKGTITMNASATASIVDVIFFIWNDDDTPVQADILANVAVNGQLNIGESDKYKVFYRRQFVVDSNMPLRHFKVYKKFGNHHIKYRGSGSTAYEKGTIWCMTISNEATNTPAFASYNRLRFIDN